MSEFFQSILLYPYPYKTEAVFITFLVLLPFALLAFGIYRLIVWKMNLKGKKRINTLLAILGISIGVLFFAEVTVSLITISSINKQLGFAYTTPETPEGELFKITKIRPGGIMEKAGLKPDDQVQMWKVNDLYKLLINNQGKVVEIPIKRNDEKLQIKVKVPELDIPLGSISFLF